MIAGNFNPDWSAAMKARAEFDEQVNKVITLLAPPPGESVPVPTEPVTDYIAARVRLARRALDAFEAAMKGATQ